MLDSFLLIAKGLAAFIAVALVSYLVGKFFTAGCLRAKRRDKEQQEKNKET